jgi:hypothetical protein
VEASRRRLCSFRHKGGDLLQRCGSTGGQR